MSSEFEKVVLQKFDEISGKLEHLDNKIDAEYAKRHNDANVLAFSMHKSPRTIVKFIEIFNKNKVDEDPIYRKRNELVERYENEH